MALSWAELAAGTRFFRELPGFLRHPVPVAVARRILADRLAGRDGACLDLLRQVVSWSADHPYRRLLRHAGCEYVDLERLVTQEGADGALRRLAVAGVYLTLDEFKGREAIQRGSLRFMTAPAALRNPDIVAHVPARTSGRRGVATPVVVDLDFMREIVVDHCLVLDVWRGDGWRHAVWGVPGGAAFYHLLRLAGAGARPERWFTQVDPAGSGLHPRYRWSVTLAGWASRLAAAPLPSLEHVPLENPLPIVRWLRDVVRTGGTPHLQTFASMGVRLAGAAIEAGLDLAGSVVTLSGEPITDARLAVVRRAGASPRVLFGAMEAGGTLGMGCLAPEVGDEVHLFRDLRAIIQPGRPTPPKLTPDALLVTTLRRGAPFVLLNVSLGDRAVLGARACGCPFDALGWSDHAHTVRSYAKITAGGMAFLDSDLARVLEEALPARFGGGPTDYQIVEEELDGGRPRIRLVVHPAVGPLDEEQVVETFLAAMGAGSGVERVGELVWRDGDFVKVDRQPPTWTSGGKIVHLHRAQEGRSADLGER